MKTYDLRRKVNTYMYEDIFQVGGEKRTKKTYSTQFNSHGAYISK